MERMRSSARPSCALGALLTALWLTAPLPAAGAGDDAVARGEHTYQTLCATCHGRYGRGDGPLASALKKPLPDFTDPAVLGSRSDDQLLAAIQGGDSGHTPMAIGQVLQESALRDTIAYLRTLYVPGQHVSVAAGRDIYQTSCWVCHGRKGDGKGPAAATLKDKKRPRDFTNPDFVIEGREKEVERAIALGPAEAFHGSPFMPEWSSRLSPQQIRDVVAYLKTFRKVPGKPAAPKQAPPTASGDEAH